jgi:methylated-DNA-protein-cysteine methyltransferase-like protein
MQGGLDRHARERLICDMVRRIPAGSVASYGQVAELAGVARGARLVGRVLGRYGDAGLPWHRVLLASGRIAFERASPAYAKQRERLLAEGVSVDSGRVDMRRFRWQPDLDELIWKPVAARDDP